MYTYVHIYVYIYVYLYIYVLCLVISLCFSPTLVFDSVKWRNMIDFIVRLSLSETKGMS